MPRLDRPSPEHRDEPLVSIAVAPDEVVTALWTDILTDAGIRSMSRMTGPGAGYFRTNVDAVEIYVLASDAERARMVLAEAQEGRIVDDDLPQDDLADDEAEPSD